MQSCRLGLPIQPPLDAGYLVFADDYFLVGGGSHVDAHLAEEIGGELLYGGSADDELSVHAHKTLWVELLFNFFQSHVQRMMLSGECAEAHHTVADGDVAF